MILVSIEIICNHNIYYRHYVLVEEDVNDKEAELLCSTHTAILALLFNKGKLPSKDGMVTHNVYYSVYNENYYVNSIKPITKEEHETLLRFGAISC